MSFKVAKDSIGNVTACGPNTDSFQPTIRAGGTLEISDTFQPITIRQDQLDKLARRAAIKTTAESDNFIAQLREHTAAEWTTFATNNISNLGDAKTAIIKLGIAIQYLLQGGTDK